MGRPAPQLVSVIVPVLDEAENLADQLEALAGQTYGGAWELLVVDNGSTDGSCEVAQMFASRLPLRIVDASSRTGINHARNAGVAAAQGDFVAFCDGDDIASAGWVDALVAASGEADIVAGSLDFVSLNDSRQRAWQPDEPLTGLPIAHDFLPYAPGGNCGMWTEVARAVGWDEAFGFGSSDIEFSWRAQLAGYGIVFAPDAIVLQRYRRTLRALARQYFAYGRSGRQLERAFANRGLPVPDSREVGDRLRWLGRHVPDLLESSGRRGNWIRVAAFGLGHLVGGARLREGRSRPRGIHLVEAGLRWPPETFVTWKVEGLAGRGLQVTAASTSRSSESTIRLRGVRRIREPRWDEPGVLRAFGGVRDGLMLALTDRQRFGKLARLLWNDGEQAGTHRLTRTIGGLRDYAWLARLRPDVVHFEWESAAVRYLSVFDALQCPMVVSCHGAGVNVYPSALPYVRGVTELGEIFRRASAVHCTSEGVASRAEDFGLPRVKACVIRPAVDPDFFVPNGARTESGELRIVSVGDLIWVKGYEYGLRALAMLVNDGIDARLDILGGEPRVEQGYPSDRPRIEQAIADLGLADRATLHGACPSETVREFLQEGHVFLHSSLSEGIPTVALEAMACGLPVVTSDCGDVREAIRDGVDGLVVPVRDARALADAVRTLAENPAVRRSMGTSARARVCEAFTLDAQLDAYVGLYERVLATQGKE